jgi:hypothetical protein
MGQPSPRRTAQSRRDTYQPQVSFEQAYTKRVRFPHKTTIEPRAGKESCEDMRLNRCGLSLESLAQTTRQVYLTTEFAVASSFDKDPVPQAVAIRRLRTGMTPVSSTTKVE